MGTDLSAMGNPIKQPLPIIPIAAADSLWHARSVINALIENTLKSGVPGEPPTMDQIKAAFNRIRYDIELAEAQAGIKR